MTVAIVLAAGSGKRMNSDVAKQFLKINGKEVLYYSLLAFENNKNIDEIVLVTKEEDIDYCRNNIVEEYGFKKVGKIISGGKERYDSVYCGLCAIYDVDVVLIHDGARPFVTSNMIDDAVWAAKEYGACTVAVPVKDTIKIVDDNLFGVETPDRKKLYQIQTPQAFDYSLIMSAYEGMKQCPNYNITDDTMLVEQYKGVRSKMIEGSYNNLKITTPEDLEIAEKIASKIF